MRNSSKRAPLKLEPRAKASGGPRQVGAEADARLLSQYRAALDAHSIVAITDTAGRITFANDKFCEISGYQREELIGQNHRIINSGHHDGPFFRQLWTTIARGQIWKGEIKNRSKEGSIYWVDTTIFPFLDALGKPAQYVAIRTDITRRKQQEVERLRLEREVLEIGERERQRIGQDLHDDLGQQLAGIELMTQALERKLAERSAAESSQAAKIAEHVRAAIRQTRALARGLSPVNLDAGGLASALRELVANVQTTFRVKCSLVCNQPSALPKGTAAMHLFRICQESVSNAIKHGKATEIQVSLVASPKRITLTIQDNGTGIPLAPPSTTGMGLRIMDYRATVAGGVLDIQSGPRGGTRITCNVGPAEAPPQQNLK